ncbi:unannotated protein [freshwater metagenome]|uniref:Unannotated protein n=1 Tax=freshwater metagenome TaxID=449393 RepID=A0A6J7HQZ7_9ZZZZ
MRDGLKVQLEFAVQVPVSSLEPVDRPSEGLLDLRIGQPSDPLEDVLCARYSGKVQFIARDEDAAHDSIGARHEVHFGAMHKGHRRAPDRCEAA